MEEQKPRRRQSWSQRGYKTIYLSAEQKRVLVAAALAEGDPTVADYVMRLHRYYQEHKP